MVRKEGPEIEFYEGFEVADSFQTFVTAGDLGGTKERLVLYGQREDGAIEKIVRANWFGEEVLLLRTWDAHHPLEVMDKIQYSGICF